MPKEVELIDTHISTSLEPLVAAWNRYTGTSNFVLAKLLAYASWVFVALPLLWGRHPLFFFLFAPPLLLVTYDALLRIVVLQRMLQNEESAVVLSAISRLEEQCRMLRVGLLLLGLLFFFLLPFFEERLRILFIHLGIFLHALHCYAMLLYPKEESDEEE